MLRGWLGKSWAAALLTAALLVAYVVVYGDDETSRADTMHTSDRFVCLPHYSWYWDTAQPRFLTYWMPYCKQKTTKEDCRATMQCLWYDTEEWVPQR